MRKVEWSIGARNADGTAFGLKENWIQVVARRPVVSMHAVVIAPKYCLPATRSVRPADISGQQDEAYSSCARKRLAESLDRSDVARLREASAPPEITAKIEAIEARCRAETAPKD